MVHGQIEPLFRKFFLKGALLSALLLVFAGNSFSQGKLYRHEKHRFSFLVPDPFEVIDTSVDGVAVLLKAKGAVYPTFNVVVLPGRFSASSKKKGMLLKELLADYGRVGITGIKVIESSRFMIDGRSGFLARLNYQYGGKDLLSVVLEVSGVTKHFVLTFIAENGTFVQYSELYDNLIKSFKFQSDREFFEKTEKTSPSLSLWAALLLFVLILYLVLVLRRDHS